MLDDLRSESGSLAAADEALGLMADLYPLCRSITGDGVRATLDRVHRLVPLERVEVRSGTAVLDWEVPDEWNVRDAWVADARGHRLIDFRRHSLHLMSYSTPVRATLSREQLEPHLHSLPEQPDWIPYRTSYYRRDWGFCLRHRDRLALGDGPFDVVIDATLAPGHLTYAECTVGGTETAQGLVYTHTCHPSLANDNLSGIAAAAVLAAALARETPRLHWRFVFGPGTIGSLAWLSRNLPQLPHIAAGLVVGLLGDRGPLTYKRSRRGDRGIDRLAQLVLTRHAPDARLVDFEPYGYDERQFCSPGIDLPMGRLTRSPNDGYAEYHSSADDLSLISRPHLAQSLRVLAHLVCAADANRRLVNLRPMGEPRLGRHGLYRPQGGAAPGEFEHALLWVLSLSDGRADLAEIAARSRLDMALLSQAAGALAAAGLVRDADAASADPPRQHTH